MEEKDRTKEGPAGGSSNMEAKRHPQPNHRLKHRGSEDPGGTQPGRNTFKENGSSRSVEPKRIDGVGEGASLTRGSSRQGTGGAGGLQVEEPSRTHTSWSVGQEPQRSRTHFPPQHLQRGRASGEPPPPGTSPPDRHPEAQPVQCLQRCWESVASSAGVEPAAGSPAFDFSVASYNILSQELLEDNAYLYRHCHPAVLPWSHRLPNLLAEIQRLDADILCLQEVQEDHYLSQIKPALQTLGYQCAYKKRTGSKPDGCAIVFRDSRLSLLSSNPVEFLVPGDTLLDRDNVGLVVLLQPRLNPSAVILVANTHLLYNPRRGDIKLAQLAILLAEIDRLSRLPDGSASAVVLCGDFNSTPWSPLYSLLTEGYLDYRGLSIGMVSGQEVSPKGHRLLSCPIWSPSLGITQRCRYQSQSAESSGSSPTVEGAISNLTVEDVAASAAAAVAAALHRKRLEHDLKLQSTYQHCLLPDGRPEVTTCHSRTAITVDYILYTPELHSGTSLPGGRGLQLLGKLSLVSHQELQEVAGLPNQHHSSDHLPLLARFRLRC